MRFRRFPAALLAGLVGLAGLLALSPRAQAAPSVTAPPRLVVLVAIDGLPMRQVTQWQDRFGPDGFNRFLRQGRTYTEAHYRHAHTVTGAGHATMMTGAYPQRSGIIGNEWLQLDTLQSLYCTEDRAHRYLAGGPTAPDAGTSPQNLLAETVGDVLIETRPGARVFGVSGKDRGAILPVGHRGVAYMYRSDSGLFTSSTYYMPAHPAWVNAFNARRPADAYWGQVWKPLLPDAAYADLAPDGQPWMSSAGYGNRLPATMGANQSERGPRYYTDLLTSPFGDALTLDFARALVRAEHLGQDGTSDLLTISLSAHDYISHAFGPESRLAHDHLLQVDRLLGAFFQDLDRWVGRGQWAVVLTADHGFSESPEWRQRLGQNARRFPMAAALSAVNTHLRERFGLARAAVGSSTNGLVFDEAAIRSRGLSAQAVYDEAAAVLRGIEGVAEVNTRADLASSAPPRADQRFLAAQRLGWHPDRSPPVVVAFAEGWIASGRATGATHGSPYRYDQHVPILLWGPRWWGGPARLDDPVQVVDIAPTIAQLLGLRAPAQSQGQVLPGPDRKLPPGGKTGQAR
jgi:predicted AlkP superfamily pyrophosphatase or phosphodiesterase